MKAYAALFAAVLAWGLEYPIMKKATDDAGVLTTGAVMFLLAALLLLAYLLLHGGGRAFLRPSLKTYGLMVLIGGIGVTIDTCALLAITLTSIVNVAALARADVLFSLVLSAFIFHERIDRTVWFFAPVMLAGVGLLTGFFMRSLETNFTGDTLILMSAFLVALNAYIIKQAGHDASPLLIGLINATLNGVAFLAAALIIGQHGVTAMAANFMRLDLLLLGILATVFFVGYNTALQTIPVWVVRLACLVAPVVAGLAGWAWLNEGLPPTKVAGMSLICGSAAGIILLRRPQRQTVGV